MIFVPGLLFFLRLNIVFQPLNDTIKENHVSLKGGAIVPQFASKAEEKIIMNAKLA